MSSRIWKYVSLITFHSLLPEHTQLQMMQWSTISQDYQKVWHSICIVMEISFSDWTIVFTHNSSSAEAVFSRKAQGCPTWDICKSVFNYGLRDGVRRSQIWSLVLWVTVSFYMIENKILGLRVLWYLYCHSLTFCLLEQTVLPCEATFSIAMPGLQNLFVLVWQATAKSIRARSHWDPDTVLEPRLKVHLWDWTLGWLPQDFCPLCAESQLNQWNSSEPRVPFVDRLTKGIINCII